MDLVELLNNVGGSIDIIGDEVTFYYSNTCYVTTLDNPNFGKLLSTYLEGAEAFIEEINK